MLRDAEGFHRERQIDIVIFSGDLGFSGKKADLELAREILLTPLTRALSLPNDRIVMIPGNHDVDRSKVNSIFESGLRANLTTRAKLNELLDDKKNRAEAARRLDAWERFRAAFYGAAGPSAVGGLARVHRYELGEATVGVAALNSAWRCSGDDDFKRVLVGARQIEDAMASIENDSIRIVALHHPLSWLADFDAKSVKTELERRADLILCGHEHMAAPESVTSVRGTAVFVHAGCLYEHHEYHNSYSLIDVDTEQRSVDISLRTWWADRGEFGVAEDVAHGGKASFRLRGADVASDAALARQGEGTGDRRAPQSSTHEDVDEIAFVLRVAACARLADSLVSVWETLDGKRRAIQLISREVTRLTHDEETLAAVDLTCPGAARAIRQFLTEPLSDYLSHVDLLIAWRKRDADTPDDVDDDRKRAREAFVRASIALDERLKGNRDFAFALAEQEEFGVWRAFGFQSVEHYREFLQPTMQSLEASPGELAELTLRKLLTQPLSPEQLAAEGVPDSISVDLMNRLLSSSWVRWKGDEIELTALGAEALEARLAEWHKPR